VTDKTAITVAYGDGIGPEIMTATLEILHAAEAGIELETIEIGRRVFERGFSAGIEPSAWESLRRTKVFLKAPITTPQGGGFKSLNVTIRKTLGLFANVRPCIAYFPYVRTLHPGMDLVIIRENEEDLYAGIEYRGTDEVYQALKIITRPGCEKIVRYAFEYARAHERKKLSCFSKDNIMKMTDGLFHKVFDEIGADYPDIMQEHKIIDIGTARLAAAPEQFDVIVTTNLYGDVLSDVAAEIAGSVGMAGSANIGELCAMFEAIHGSAPDIAGAGVANPSGLLHGAIMMLVHVGQPEVAETVHNAWLTTIEDGIHTADVASDAHTIERVGTDGFAKAVVARLGKEPLRFRPARYARTERRKFQMQRVERPPAHKELVGVDVFVHVRFISPDDLAGRMAALQGESLKLTMVSNRGVKVWPEGMPETYCTDHWRCRFAAAAKSSITHRDVIDLLFRMAEAGVDFIETENLYKYDGEPGYSMGQGE
jgi:isocitrate dehydrogenase